MEKRYKGIEFSRADGVFAVALLAAGFLFWNWISLFRPGAGAAAFTAALCLMTGLYLKQKGCGQNRRSLVCLGMIVFSATAFVLFDSYVEKVIDLALIMFLFIYWVALTAKSTIEPRLSGCTPVDLIHQIFARGFTNFLVLPVTLSDSTKKSKNGKGAAAALIGIVVMIPILFVVTKLLISADMAFETLMKRIGQTISQDILIYVWYFILGVPVACYLCSLIWGNVMKRPEAMTRDQVEESLSGFRIAPPAAIYSALAMLNLVYVIFFVSQAVYLFSAFESVLPGGMTYAEYARRGFFELCAVAAINLGLIILVQFLIKNRSGMLLKIEMMVLSVFTMLLTATGISKMVLYIQSYGLTRLRIYTSAFMILLFVVFLIILLRQVVKFNTGRTVIITVLVCFAVFCYGNIDGQIAKYNMNEYLKGNLELMERESMRELSDGAVPYLYAAYQKTKDEKAKEELYAAITGDDLVSQSSRPEEGTFKAYNLQMRKAMKLREEMSKELPAGWKELKENSRATARKITCGFYYDPSSADTLSLNLNKDGTFELNDADGYADGRFTVDDNKCVLYLNMNYTGLEDQVIDKATFELDKKGGLVSNQDMGKILKKGSVLSIER